MEELLEAILLILEDISIVRGLIFFQTARLES